MILQSVSALYWQKIITDHFLSADHMLKSVISLWFAGAFEHASTDPHTRYVQLVPNFLSTQEASLLPGRCFHKDEHVAMYRSSQGLVRVGNFDTLLDRHSQLNRTVVLCWTLSQDAIEFKEGQHSTHQYAKHQVET